MLQENNSADNKTGSTKEGERFEILNVDKRNNKAKVKNLENDQTSTLSGKCSATFTPLLDWRNYSARDLKSQFGFPTRVRLENRGNRTEEEESLVSSTTDLTIVNEIEEVLVVASTLGSLEFKFCYEIPRDLPVKVTVAKGFLKGDGIYKEVLAKLNKTLDQSKLLNIQQSSLIKLRNAITEYKYESNKDLFLDVEEQRTMKSVEENTLQNLSPTKSHLSSSKRFSARPPVMPKKHVLKPRSQSVIDDQNSKSAGVFKPRSLSVPVDLGNQKNVPPVIPPKVLLRPKNVPKEPSNIQYKERAADHPGCADVTDPESPSRQPTLLATSLNHLSPNEVGEYKHNSESPRDPARDPPVNSSELDPRNVPEKTRKLLSVPTLEVSVPPSKDPKGSQSTAAFSCVRSSLHPMKVSDGSTNVPPALPPRQPSISKRSKSKPLPVRSMNEIEENEYLLPSEILWPQTSFCPHDVGNKTNSSNMDNNLGDSIYEEVSFSEHSKDNVNYENSSVTRDSQGPEQDMESRYVNVSKIPQDLSCLSVKDVAQLLRNLHMECYIKRFEEEMIDGHLLKNLKEDDLLSLKMSSFHVTKLTEFIKGWRPKHL